MGLKNYKKFKIRQEILDFLLSYGITQADLIYLPEALKIVANHKLEEQRVITSPSQKEKDEYELKVKGKTPEDFIKAFSGEIEEFYPNGRPSKDN